MKATLTALCIFAAPAFCRADASIDFNRDVRPILSDRCFHCHGPDEEDRQAELRLDVADGPDGAHRILDGIHAIKPGSVEESEVWRRITADEYEVMPPPDSSKQPLDAAEQEIIKRWIEQGAAYADFWAFVPPVATPAPEVDDRRWNESPIDRYVRQRLQNEGLTPKATADKRTLIRRLSFDLTGLPPTRAEIQGFLADDSVDAYQRLVDRLLVKPQYGEHMTRYWLDLVRFADTNGIHHDHFRDMSPYRDWVIRAFNDNLPYEDFVKYQLAGDLFAEPTTDQLVASGFHRLHLIIDRGTALPEESYTRNVIDRVTAVGTAFLGLTVQCAVCHDHKYDPITTRDFYQLFAFMNNLDADPETGSRNGTDFERGLQPPYISLANSQQRQTIDELERRIDEARSAIKQLEAKREKASAEETNEDAKAELDRAQARRKELTQEKDLFEASIPAAMVMKEREEPRPAYILLRGAYDNPGEQVERGTPAFLPPMETENARKTRMDLADWFVSRRHPLTARVAVNRFWQQFFGTGIVKTAEDFGAQGDWPSHPELLDYLAVSFVESGWDVKALLKQIVMTETYRQQSAATPAEYRRDPDNRLLARGARFRMDAEVIRDMFLATSGMLNSAMYGKSVKPPQPPGLWKAVSMPSSYPRVYEPDVGDKIYRRSLYTFWKRGMPPPQMTILNAPTREACIARRERTNTPLQALLLLNEPEYLKAARQLALETLADRSLARDERLEIIYETVTARIPDADVVVELGALADDLARKYDANPRLAADMCRGLQMDGEVSREELAAWTMLVSTIYNLDIAKTRG